MSPCDVNEGIDSAPLRQGNAGRRGLAGFAMLAVHALAICALYSLGPTVSAPLAPTLHVVLLGEPAAVPPRPPRMATVSAAASRSASLPEQPRLALPVAGDAVPPHTADRVSDAVPPAPTISGRGEAAPATTAPRFDADYLHNPAPPYPPLSRRAREEGTVLLRVKVADDGHVLEVAIEQGSGFDRLDLAARAAVSQWQFVPAMQGGNAIIATVLVPIRFSLAA